MWVGILIGTIFDPVDPRPKSPNGAQIWTTHFGSEITAKLWQSEQNFALWGYWGVMVGLSIGTTLH